MALERRLRRRPYRRLWTSKGICACVTAMTEAIRVELIRLFKVESAVECLCRCVLLVAIVVKGAVIQCP